MNREHKKKTLEKGYYKTHPCNDTFICKFCGKTVAPTGAGSNHRNHCHYCCDARKMTDTAQIIWAKADRDLCISHEPIPAEYYR